MVRVVPANVFPDRRSAGRIHVARQMARWGAVVNIDIRLGRWQDVLTDFGGVLECDVQIADPPYGSRTHENSTSTRRDGKSGKGLSPSYPPWTPADVRDYVHAWSPAVRGWMVNLTSHDLIPAWEAAFEEVDRFCFAPIPCVMRGMSVRLQGDGPSSWTSFAMVARRRTRDAQRWRTLPGAYVGAAGDEAAEGRGKPLWLMSALVRDYSNPGDLVIDPLAGWGSTLIAAESLGRRAIGADMVEAAVIEARRRAARGIQAELVA